MTGSELTAIRALAEISIDTMAERINVGINYIYLAEKGYFDDKKILMNSLGKLYREACKDGRG